jgi:hypothetical protein
MTQHEANPQVSDEAVQAKTGKAWAEWLSILDAAGAERMSHKEIVAHLREQHGIGAWWQQTVAVTYERARGLRDKHQKPDGYEISVSKTVPAPSPELFSAWNDAERRAEWLASDALDVHRATDGKSMRAGWRDDGSRLDVYFYAKGPDKSQVSVSHGRLASAQDAERIKAFWAEQLERLKSYLAGAK